MRRIKCIDVLYAHKDADILYSIEDLRKMDHISAEHMARYECAADGLSHVVGFVKSSDKIYEFVQVFDKSSIDKYELGEEINA